MGRRPTLRASCRPPFPLSDMPRLTPKPSAFPSFPRPGNFQPLATLQLIDPLAHRQHRAPENIAISRHSIIGSCPAEA